MTFKSTCDIPYTCYFCWMSEQSDDEQQREHIDTSVGDILELLDE